MFIRHKGKTKLMHLPIAASVAVLEGSVVAFASGTIIPATNTTAAYDCVGVSRKTVATTDDDYAVAKLIPVEVPVEMNVEWEADVKVGTLATSSVGLYFDLTTADDGSGIDQSASTYDIAQCTKFITTAKGLFVLNIGAQAIAKA
jgi:hypothetical protein